MKHKVILLVDEKAPVLKDAGYILQDRGYLVMLAPDAVTAFEDVGNYHFDLILVSLAGYEADKLNLLRRAKKSSPQAKLLVVENSNTTLPAEAFKFEVDDYLLRPFTTPELCAQVDRCLRGDQVDQDSPEEKAEAINKYVLNEVRSKICNIHNGLFSLRAHVNTLIDQNHTLLDEDSVGKIHEIYHDIVMLTSVTENLLYNMLFCCDENESRSIDKKPYYGLL